MKLNYLYGAKSHFFESSIPEFDNAITMDDLSSSSDEYTIESWLGRVNYDFDDKYYVSGSIRGDGSSRFAKGNRGVHSGHSAHHGASARKTSCRTSPGWTTCQYAPATVA